MDLPDCPPGAEGYEDSVVEMPKKPNLEECTKAEQEFQEHLNSLKIEVENVGRRCMVERRGRDVSGKWTYMCFPCAAVCSGESILQTHISGKKHKTKLAMRTVWPQSIFEKIPSAVSDKVVKEKDKYEETPNAPQKIPEEVNVHNVDEKFDKYRQVRCHIQESLDAVKTPLIGLEFLVEHPPEKEHYEPSYMCTLCKKQGHPRTIINHLTSFWHRYNYLVRYFPKAIALLSPYRGSSTYREGVNVVINRLTQRIEDKYGRLKPVHIDKEEFDRDIERIHHWISRNKHLCDSDGPSFEEVVDIGLIESLRRNPEDNKIDRSYKRDPSPPVVAAPTKPMFNNYTKPAGRQQRNPSTDALSDISDEPEPQRSGIEERSFNNRYAPYRGRNQDNLQHRFTNKNRFDEKGQEKKVGNGAYKQKLLIESCSAAEAAAKKLLAYHEKNPEKHPLYPEEWKKFWNRRYKEIQAEGKDASKHDFKPEWIQYWTVRMKELHEDELRVQIAEVYRRLCLPLPDDEAAKTNCKSPERRRSPDPRRRSPDPHRRSPDPRRRSPDQRRRSPDQRRRSPDQRRRSPDPRRRSPDSRRRSPYNRPPDQRNRFPEQRRRSPGFRSRSPNSRRRSPDMRRKSPDPRHYEPDPKRRSMERRRTPDFNRFKWRNNDDRNRMRSSERRVEVPRPGPTRSRSPLHPAAKGGAGAGGGGRASRSPLSRRAAAPPRNRSPARHALALAPSMQTVLVSDDDLHSDGESPWNPDGSPSSVTEAKVEARRTAADLGPPENVVATLRILVALEDYLGSLGPKLVDLLAEALKMEKEKANSSEELLLRDSAVVLLETTKEKLKGAVQAGLVPATAVTAARAAIVRAAATLHAADTRQKKQKSMSSPAKAVPVAGVGAVDRAQIAEQMAAALVAEGKTDVSAEELAQLVDAVVGMAEAKQREADRTPQATQPRPHSTATALQMLQTAYDENDKRIENDAPDAMDGLSDSDLETLLKNFNELSAEEQHSLIAYLKKLEAREPQRVERLRQYVSTAAPDVPRPVIEPPTVAVESDDDDYTVEEVFQSATQKVKEDQIRQEMEIVKKSLEESTKETTETKPVKSPLEVMKNQSSATDLLALVQASVKSTAGKSSDVVTSHTHPRSFGDLPEAPMSQESKPPQVSHSQQTLSRLLGTVQSLNQEQGQINWNQRSDKQDRPPKSDFIGSITQDSRGQFNQDARGSPFTQNSNEPYDQDNRAPLGQDNRPFSQDARPIQDNRAPYTQDNRGPFNQDNRAPFNQDNRAPFMQDRGPYNQDNRAPFNQDNRPLINQDNRAPLNPDNRVQFNQDNRGHFNQDNRAPFTQDNRPFTQENIAPFTQDNRAPYNQDNRGYNQDNVGQYNDNNRSSYNPDNQSAYNNDNRAPFNNNRVPFNNNPRPPFNQNNTRPMMQGGGMQNNRFPAQNTRAAVLQDNRGNFAADNRGPVPQGSGYDNYSQNTNQYNQGNRGNFNGREQQQYGNYDQQKSFRGRGGGRGNFGGGMRGRGRGNFY